MFTVMFSKHPDVFVNKEGLHRRRIKGNFKNTYSCRYNYLEIWKLRPLLQLLTNYLKNTCECGVYF